MEDDGDYGIGQTSSARVIPPPAPDVELPYRPRDPQNYRPAIGLIGCGGISEMHLRAYENAGYEVVALCSRNRERAEARRREFFPDADIYLDYRDLLARDDIEVVDITTHPQERVPIIEAAIDAKKHILSQKPFVVDLDIGLRLLERAEARGVLLAVNQNGRWAPHFSYLRHALKADLLGTLCSAHFSVHWDHSWIAGTPFEDIADLVLYDFGIHWFDMAAALLAGRTVLSVYASAARSPAQNVRPALLAQVAIQCEDAQIGLFFNGYTQQGQRDRTYVVGTQGSFESTGPDLTTQNVALYTREGVMRPELEGTWFGAGFHGAMAELLCAIAEKREPEHGARNNLESLALCFAAVASARSGQSFCPGQVRRLPGK